MANDWRKLVERGAALLKQGHAGEALAELQRAERLAPGERLVRYWLGNAWRMAGNGERAVTLLKALLAENPEDFETAFALAYALRDLGRPNEAAEVLAATSRNPGVTPHQLLQVGGFLRESNQIKAAIEVCERALAALPDEADLHFKLGRLYQAAGDFDKSLSCLRRTLELNPGAGSPWIALCQQKRFDSDQDPEYRRLQKAAGESHGRETDMCLAFALGKALDDLGRWPEAWAQYRRGNELMARGLTWNPRAWERLVDRALSARPLTIPPETIVQQASGDRAVFIVGMPRSGTTLLEQLLDRHPQITGRGELNQLPYFAVRRAALGPAGSEQRRQAARVLWTQMRLEGPDDHFYIDKNPLNFRHLDLLFELLPSARVLHVTRDGRASCLSNYFQLFEHADTAFSCDLDNLASFYAGYRRLMAHWERLWPERILRIEYDRLVRNTREALEPALAFLGLAWDEVLAQAPSQERVVRGASAWQARQPVHTSSVERWRRYYDQAPGFFDRLAAIDAQYRGLEDS